MARPARNNAEYFTHSANLRNDRRVKAIRSTFGASGYGILIMLIEVLTDVDYTQLNTEELEVELLAGDFGVSVTEINRLIQFAEKVGFLVRTESRMLQCPDLNKWLEPVFEKRNRSRSVAKVQSKGISVTETYQSATETEQSVTESTQSKEEKSKVENINKDNAGSDDPANVPDLPGDIPKPDYTDEFEVFWKQYGKFTANKKRAFDQWKKLSRKDKQKAVTVLPAYLKHQPNSQFRKDPETWFRQRTFDIDFSASTDCVQPIGQRPFII